VLSLINQSEIELGKRGLEHLKRYKRLVHGYVCTNLNRSFFIKVIALRFLKYNSNLVIKTTGWRWRFTRLTLE